MSKIEEAKSEEKKGNYIKSIELYESGVDELERSLKTFKDNKMFNDEQVSSCQHEIDSLYRDIIKIQKLAIKQQKTKASKKVTKKRPKSPNKHKPKTKPKAVPKPTRTPSPKAIKTKKPNKSKNKNSTNDNSNIDDSKTQSSDQVSKKKQSKTSKQDNEFRDRLKDDIITETPNVSFKDIQGLNSVKLALYETIILPELKPELFTGLRKPTSGLLLFGPPGNGKTMIAKAVASSCKGTFFNISASSITSKWVGNAERIMRTLFNMARENSPSIIFIDEIDSLLTTRGGNNEAESSRRIKTEFLIQFDGVKKESDINAKILVIGATNLPDQLDDAVLRRFGKRILVPLPDKNTREGLLKILIKKQRHNLNNSDFNKIVDKTDGYSCSDISQVCKDAAMGPIRDLGADIVNIENKDDMPYIELKHFVNALNNVRPSLSKDSLKYYKDWNDKFGSKIHLSSNALPENMRPDIVNINNNNNGSNNSWLKRRKSNKNSNNNNNSNDIKPKKLSRNNSNNSSTTDKPKKLSRNNSNNNSNDNSTTIKRKKLSRNNSNSTRKLNKTNSQRNINANKRNSGASIKSSNNNNNKRNSGPRDSIWQDTSIQQEQQEALKKKKELELLKAQLKREEEETKKQREQERIKLQQKKLKQERIDKKKREIEQERIKAEREIERLKKQQLLKKKKEEEQRKKAEQQRLDKLKKEQERERKRKELEAFRVCIVLCVYIGDIVSLIWCDYI